MTTCTPIYGLPVVEGSDRPCDIDDWSCSFAAAVEAQLDVFDAAINRTATTVPLVKVAMTTELPNQPEGITASTVFDSVYADTDNMFSGDQPDRLIINTPGIYAMRGFLWCTTSGAGADASGIELAIRQQPAGSPSPLTRAIDNRIFHGNGINCYVSCHTIYPLNANDLVFLNNYYFAIPPNLITIKGIDFSLNWLGDLP